MFLFIGALGDIYAFERKYRKAEKIYEMAMRKAGENRALYLQNKTMHKKMIKLNDQASGHED